MKIKKDVIHYVIWCLFLIITSSFAQAPDTLWTRTYGGYYQEYGYSVKQTTDGGFITVGSTKTYGNGGYDIWLLKLNENGDTLWTKTYGGQYDEVGYSIITNSDGDYIIAGRKNNYSLTYDDFWLLKINPGGDTIWTRSYGGNHNDYARSVQQTSDGGYIIAGTTRSFGQGIPAYSNIYLVKTDANGDTIWTRVYGEDGLVDDAAYAVIQTSDNGFLVCGYTGISTQYDIYLIKTDAAGNIIWKKIYGGTGEDVGTSVLENNGAYVVAGSTNSYGPHPSNFYLLKLDMNGDTIWTKVYDGGSDDHCHSAQKTFDGGYIMVGFTYQYDSDVFLIRTDSMGNVIWSKVYPRMNYGDEANEIQFTSDGGYIIVGYTYYFYSNWARAYEQLYLMRIEPETGIEEYETSEEFMPLSAVRIIPNPFTKNVIFEYYLPKATLVNIGVYNIPGQKVDELMNRIEQEGLHRLFWDGYDSHHNELPAGVYFVEFNGLLQKIIKLK